MNPYDIHAEAICAVESEMGDDCPFITWNRNNYKVLPGSIEQNRPLREGGFSHIYDFQCLTRVAQYLTAQISNVDVLSRQLTNKDFIYANGHYNVSRIIILSGGTLIRIVANAANQNA